MQGFKNLLPRPLLNDDSVQPIVKKTDQHRKTTQCSLQHFFNIYKNIELFSQSFEGQVFQLHHILTQTESKLPTYYLQLTQLFKNINVEVKIFSQKSNSSYKELNIACNALFFDYSNVVLNFQQHIRNYQAIEQIVFEMSKRYSRNHKNMVTYLQSYKSSFTDARLIYNSEQKVKRYQLCESTFKTLTQDLKSIQEKCQKLSEKKLSIRENFIQIQNQMKGTIKVLGNKLIGQTKRFVKNYSQFQKNIVTFLAQKKYSLQKLNIPTFFQSLSNTNFSQYFSCPVQQADCRTLPALFVYIQSFKAEYLPYSKAAFLSYYKEACEKVHKRKEVNIQLLELLKTYCRMIQKYSYTALKEICTNFEKLKKRLAQLYSPRFVSFLKSIHSIFELAIGINQKLLKSFNSKLKNIQTYLTQQNKHMQMFLKQLNSNIEKFITVKKQARKSSDTQNTLEKSVIKEVRQQPTNIAQIHRSGLFMQESFIIVDNTQFRKQIKQRAQFLVHLIMGFVSKLQGNQKVIKSYTNSIVHDYSQSVNEFYSLCCEYETIYFGEEQFLMNYKKYQADIDKTLQKETNSMNCELGFKALLDEEEENRKVHFDGQVNKFEQFKKLKKPAGLQTPGDNPAKKNIITQNQKYPEKKQVNILAQTLPDKQSGVKTPPSNNLTNNSSLKDSVNLSNSSQVSGKQSLNNGVSNINQKSDKYFEVLSKKITFLEGQEYVKSFSCAFYDKIILQGRMYITNCRLCFHSKFNPKNIFFGGTFIQIPKKDITKVQKRYNAFIFDNSLAISTVNGQMFFTSFFGRDEAFDLISRALQINNQEQFFQPEAEAPQSNLQDDQLQIQDIVQEDDIKPEKQRTRDQQISKQLQNLAYQTLIQTQIQYPKINAMKFFRLFDSGQQITHNRRTHKSFLQFCKDAVGHKQIQIHHFRPNILEYLNLNNIKFNTPLKIQRKLAAMVPISAAGVPFMPKAARSDETQSLYFVSKNKYIVESIIQNSGAPYTDSFNIRLKRTISSTQENKVTFKVQMYVNFVKSTMMKSMIESKAQEQTKSYFTRMTQQAKKYFKSLQKSRKPLTKNNGQSQQQPSNTEQLQQMRKQLDQSLQQRQKLQQKFVSTQTNEANYKQFLFISIVVNLFLLLLLFN